MQSVMFVCVGNICRSPCLEAIMKSLIKQKGLEKKIFADSCAISSYHVGCKADARMRHCSQLKGITIDHTAKLFDPVFLDAFDYIFAVDEEVKEFLLSYATDKNAHKIFLVTAFSQKYHLEEMPDPYYGGDRGFEHVLDMAGECCHTILKKIQEP